MKTKLLILLILICCFKYSKANEYQDSCLVFKNYGIGYLWTNPDSLLTDTCDSRERPDNIWAKKYWVVQFDKNMETIIDTTTILEGQFFKIDDILSNNEEMKSKLRAFESQFEAIKFQWLNIKNSQSSNYLGRLGTQFVISFDNYYNSELLKNELLKIDDISNVFLLNYFIDDCLIDLYPDGELDLYGNVRNPDTVLINLKCENSFYFLNSFAKYWLICFAENILKTEQPLNSYFSYEEIDSVKYYDIYTSLKNTYLSGMEFSLFKPFDANLFWLVLRFHEYQISEIYFNGLDKVQSSGIWHPIDFTNIESQQFTISAPIKTFIKNDVLEIILDERVSSEDEEICIYDLNGKFINKYKIYGNKLIVDVSNLSTGVYFLRYDNYITKFIR